MEEKKEKADCKLWELKEWTIVVVWEHKHIMKFLWIDWMYARRNPAYWKVVIMGHANQKVSELGEIID